jgi:SAM-dependent methyltransferase
MVLMDGELIVEHPAKRQYIYFGFGLNEKNWFAELRKKVSPIRFNLAAGAIIGELGIGKDTRILEIGSGAGLLGQAIKEKVGGPSQYFCVELGEQGSNLSKGRGLSVTQANAVRLPFDTGVFDVVVSTDVFEHIPDAVGLSNEVQRVLKDDGKAFVVIADPAEGRFGKTFDHIRRTNEKSDVNFWEKTFDEAGLSLLPGSTKYRNRDWRRIFNLPVLRPLKNKPGFSCAFDIVSRPGVYILQKNG